MVGNTVSSLKLEVEELEAAKSHEQQRADHAQELLTNARNQLIQVLFYQDF
jgi:FtsZ-binding cell division protein ZapB